MINLMSLGKLLDVWKRFRAKHKDLEQFGKSLYPDALQEGTTFAILVKTPDGATYDYNLTFDAEDAQMAREIEGYLSGKK